MRRLSGLLLLAFAIPAFADITVSTVTPAAGLIEGGTIVHLHGTNLLGAPLACDALQCSVYVQFGDTLGTVVFDSANEIVVVAPAHAAGSVDLVVNVPVSPPLTLKNAFVYQDPSSDTVRVLLPIAAGTQGILNTTWQTDVLAHNETTTAVVIAGTTIPPISTQRLTLSPASTGMFLQIPRSVFEGVTITTHVHDATHDAQSLGVDIPSVPETQF
ncbi:MAG TPA: IPT/TIG domain-containing protein, partial [Thermoanaerobaculia bacterium]